MNDRLPEIPIDPDIGEFAATMTTRAIEETDEFIFRTISPFCERITEMRISKAELTAALMKQKARKPIREQWRSACPVCRATLFAGEFDGKEFENHYCPRCGQKIDFEGGFANE